MTKQTMQFAVLAAALAMSSTALVAQTPPPAAAPAAAASAPNPAGHWTGALHMGGQDIPVVLDLAKSGASYSGTLTITGTQMAELPVSGVTLDDHLLKFSVDVGESASFQGTISADGSGINGSASSSQGTADFDMMRQGDAKIAEIAPSGPLPKEFAGRWDGAINAGGTTLHLSLRLSAGPDGKALGTLVSVDQNNQEFPATTVTFTGKDISLEVRTIGASYKGTLGDNGEIAGNWTQGPGTLPLNLKKAQ